MHTRRDFLQKLTYTALAAPLLSAAQPLTFLNSDHNTYNGPVLRVAIMGLGGYGTRVAQAMELCKKAKLTGLISGTPEKVQQWQAKYNIPDKNCYNYENFDDVRNNPDIDAIYVITPNALHYEHVIRAFGVITYILSHQTPCITSMSSERQKLGNTSSAKNQWLLMQKREKTWCENVRKPMSNYWWDIVCILNQKPSRSYKCAETEISVKYIFFKDNAAFVSEIRTNGG